MALRPVEVTHVFSTIKIGSRGLLALAATTAAATVVAQAVVPSGPNKLVFPEGWNQGVMYATVDRYDTKQYREFYGPQAAVDAARAGKEIPDGTVLTLAAYAAKLDDKGVPVKDANGRFTKDKLVAVNSMPKKAGYGADIPEAVRNGDWIYQSFSPGGEVNEKANLTACFQCHLPFAKDDYLTNLAKLQGKFPSNAMACAPVAPNEVPISNFVFGSGPVKVAAGEKVTWLNGDDSPHQVTIEGPNGARTPLILKGQAATLQFDAAGNIAYRCGLHPGMKGTIEVVAKS